MKQLSIIIPHYNSPESLDKLLDSIPRHPWLNIIVVDDNSEHQPDIKDKTNCTLYTLPSDKKGAGAARNYGLKRLNSDWVLFADADDYFVENAFDTIQEEMNSEFDSIYFLPTSYNHKIRQIGARHQAYENLLLTYQHTQDKSLLYRFFVPWSKLVSTKLIKEHRINFDEVIASNDMNFSLKVAYYAQTTKVCNSTIYCVTESNNSLTKQVTESVLDSRFYAAGRYNQFCQDHSIPQYQLGMSLQIYYARKFGFKKTLSLIKYSIKNNYPLFRGLKHLFKVIKKDLFESK